MRGHPVARAASTTATTSCICQKLQCLKLYCTYFSSSVTCGPNCRCHDCSNAELNMEGQRHAIKVITTRNPGASCSKFVSNIYNLMLNNKYSKKRLGIFHGLPPRLTSCGIGVPGGMGVARSIGGAGTSIAHKVGCKCRKLACLWKYYKCFGASTWCSPNCHCVGCMNCAPGGGLTRGHPVAWGMVNCWALPPWRSGLGTDQVVGRDTEEMGRGRGYAAVAASAKRMSTSFWGKASTATANAPVRKAESDADMEGASNAAAVAATVKPPVLPAASLFLKSMDAASAARAVLAVDQLAGQDLLVLAPNHSRLQGMVPHLTAMI
jgi:hypothetical protein